MCALRFDLYTYLGWAFYDFWLIGPVDGFEAGTGTGVGGGGGDLI